MRPLGRLKPPNLDHVASHRFTLAEPSTSFTVNKVLPLPYFHKTWDQGAEGACVGFGTSMMMSIINQIEASKTGELPKTHRYDPFWLWNQAKVVDGFPDTNPGDSNGTTVSAACDILRNKGHVRVVSGKDQAVSLKEGIVTNVWATTVDEMRQAILLGTPISIGVDWYSNFDDPTFDGQSYWIGKGSLGYVRGGHCVCVYGASDKRQAFRIKNSWGESYPLVWMPYSVMQKLLDDYGEATLVTDRL